MLIFLFLQRQIMPVNAPIEYFKAEEKFKTAKNKDEKMAALEEMIRLLPKHHGSEQQHAQLKSRLAKLRRESVKRTGKREGIRKEGDAQVCIMGKTNSGKSTLLAKLTKAKPKIGKHPYTTTKPEIGMMDYEGIKIQLIEIPSTFDAEYMSIARTSDLLVLLAREKDEESGLKKMLSDMFIRTKKIAINSENENKIKEKIWASLGLMVVYTKKGKTISPMALPKGATVKRFAERVHKDFIEGFRFARVRRRNRKIQAGLRYVLQDGDIVELFMA